MSLDAFLEAAWSDHGDRPQEVADRLAASLHLVQSPEQVPPFVRLLTHVFGEHLGQWQRGVALLESLRSSPALDASAGPIARAAATLRYAGGDAKAVQPLCAEDRVFALANASSTFTARNELGQAISAYTEALRTAQAGLPAVSEAIRALAVGGNNLAAALEEKAERNALETESMISAAEAGLKYWKQAGTWLEEERAEYQLTRSLLRAGQPLPAVQSAQRCVEVCKRNDAPPFEQFFGHAVLALAARAAGDTGSFNTHRARALSHYAQVPQDDRKWCERELKELGG
jgi:tetratricopeptide (TPR) repeat protein